jgi:hypothetical protein
MTLTPRSLEGERGFFVITIIAKYGRIQATQITFTGETFLIKMAVLMAFSIISMSQQMAILVADRLE